MSAKIIAELCQNHLGDTKLLDEMIHAAAEAGATHVKIQHIHSSNLSYRPQFEDGLVQDGVIRSIKRPWSAEYDRLKAAELSAEQCSRFVEKVISLGLVPLTTCFARCDMPRILEQGFRSIKVASYDCASYTMLRELVATFDEVIVSTGATFDEEIIHAAEILAEARSWSFLHCVTIYPTPLKELHLARMEWLRQFAPSVGFSDHTLVPQDGTLGSRAALALGADAIERHFTILESDKSKDGPVSVSPSQLAEISRFAGLPPMEQKGLLAEEKPDWKEVVLGAHQRPLGSAELLNRDYYRGRFASPRKPGIYDSSLMIYNWEETPITG